MHLCASYDCVTPVLCTCGWDVTPTAGDRKVGHMPTVQRVSLMESLKAQGHPLCNTGAGQDNIPCCCCFQEPGLGENGGKQYGKRHDEH